MANVVLKSILADPASADICFGRYCFHRGKWLTLRGLSDLMTLEDKSTTGSSSGYEPEYDSEWDSLSDASDWSDIDSDEDLTLAEWDVLEKQNRVALMGMFANHSSALNACLSALRAR